MSSYAQDRKAEIAVEVWPFLQNGTLDSSYSFSYQEESGNPVSPAIVTLSGNRVSPNGWDGDTQVRDGGVLAYRPGYIGGSLAPRESALNRYFKQEGEFKSASEKYADEKRRKAIATKIFFAVMGLVLVGLGVFVYQKTIK